ncbi:MAG: VanZ family protein [Clostridiales bacterium]|nr:VanZ family protein [Clostridiales bacterium]
MRRSFRKYLGENKKRLVVLVAAALVIAFIWSQSVISSADSAKESAWFTKNVLNPVLKLFGLSVKDHVTRKIAHAFEFSVVGFLIAALNEWKPVRCLYAGLTVALLDETIQIFTKRGPSVKDVWIDLAGVAAGFLISFLVHLLLRRMRRRKARRKAALSENGGEDGKDE